MNMSSQYAFDNNDTNDHGPIRGQEDWVHDLDEIHKEFDKAAWDVTGFQEEYRVWCRGDDDQRKMHMSTYEELFAMNEKYLRIIEATLVRVKFQLEADKANLFFFGDSLDDDELMPTYKPAARILGPRSSTRSSSRSSIGHDGNDGIG